MTNILPENNFIDTCNSIFFNFTQKFNIQEHSIQRKIMHSLAVAQKCFDIASQLQYTKREILLSYAMGLFHDLGRFVQWRDYHTFDDNKSTDHGVISKEVFKNFNIDFISDKEINLIAVSIDYHTKSGDCDDEYTNKFIRIVKNADVFVNVSMLANGCHRVNQTKDGVSEQILNGFNNRERLHKYSPITKLDRILMISATIYYIDIDFLREEVLRYNYFELIYDMLSSYLNENDREIYHHYLFKLKNEYTKTR